MRNAIAKQPVTVNIDASSWAFQHYETGVLISGDCGTDQNFSVLAIGYGTELGKEYILIKNSIGQSWGIEGYGKISASTDNICGILSNPMYPQASSNDIKFGGGEHPTLSLF